MKNRILFYSSVKSKSLFNTQRFYRIDIEILQNMGYDIILSNRIIDALWFWKYDIVFSYFYRYSLFVSIIARTFGKNVYFTGGIDALDEENTGKYAYRMQKVLFFLCYILSTKCIIVSKTDMEHVEDIVGKEAKKLAYSEHTIDTNNFNERLTKEKHCNFCTIGWMGSKDNVLRKGMDKALILFAYLKKFEYFSASKFYIIGKKGEGTILLEKIIKDLKIEDSVIITGEVSESQKVDMLKDNKYYFQLSTYEGFGLAALEALIAKCIIIHSGKGGLANPIYKEHIIVNINSSLESQVGSIYNRMVNINMNKIKELSNSCLCYYDNKRRLEDFKRILS